MNLPLPCLSKKELREATLSFLSRDLEMMKKQSHLSPGYYKHAIDSQAAYNELRYSERAVLPHHLL